MTKEQIFRSDRFFTKIENGEISTTEICEEQAFDQNIRKYYNSANYRDSVDARILISEQEHRIQELEKLCADREERINQLVFCVASSLEKLKSK